MRPGIQTLLTDALAGKFEIIVAEAAGSGLVAAGADASLDAAVR